MRSKPKRKKKRQPCTNLSTSLRVVTSDCQPWSRYVRCTRCNRRLQTFWRECMDAGCWHEYLPPHKTKKQ